MDTSTNKTGYGYKNIFCGLLIFGLIIVLSSAGSANGNGCGYLNGPCCQSEYFVYVIGDGCSAGVCIEGTCSIPPCTTEGNSYPIYPGGYTCCSGLTGVGCSEPVDGSCSPCTGFTYCTKCGDGICGSGENKCRCPEDCKRDVNIIDPPLGADVCAGQTTNVTANITINATNSNDPMLGNVSVCLNVTCSGGYILNDKKYVNLSGTLNAFVTFSITPASIGQCNATTCVDCDNVINENNETDNCANTNFNAVDCSNQNTNHGVPISPIAVLAVIAIITIIAVTRIRK